MIDVMFVVDNLDIGGSELNAVRTAEHLDRSRFAVRVFCLGGTGPLADRYAKLGIPVECADSGPLARPRAVGIGWGFAKQLRRNHIRIIHAHDIYSNEFAAIWTRVAGTGQLVLSRRWLTAPKKHQFLNAMAYRIADRVLVNSRTVAQHMGQTEHIDKQRLIVIPNFLDDSAFDPISPERRQAWRAKFGIKPEDRVIGTVARLARVKDHATLLRATALIVGQWPTLKVLLVGDGPEHSPLLALAGDLGLGDRLHFTGELPHSPSPHHLLDISVLTSLREGFPNSLLEAMASTRPIIATDVGGVPEAIIDGETGLLTPAGDPSALAERLGCVLRDSGLGTRLAEQAYKMAYERYRARDVVGALESLYKTLLHGRPA
mgnify:CR=1 FL=1